MSKRRPSPATPAARPLEKDELNALERAHREAATLAAELHQRRAEVTDLTARLTTAKASAAATRGSLETTMTTIRELTARLTA